MDGNENRFSSALSALAKLAEAEQLPLVIVGGLAAIHFGHAAATQDIDIAVGGSDLDRLIMLAPEYGFKVAWKSTKVWHTLTYGEVEIKIVPEGGRARDDAPTSIPDPASMGVTQGLDYASLESWVELKISSNRQKDRGHIVEVLKRTPVDQLEGIARHLRHVHADYAETYNELLEQAKTERDQENKRR